MREDNMEEQEKKVDWHFAGELGSGHRLFIDKKTQRASIADESGSTPEDCDDGILWIDVESIRGNGGLKMCKLGVELPLLTEDGTSARCTLTLKEAGVLGALHLYCPIVISSGEEDRFSVSLMPEMQVRGTPEDSMQMHVPFDDRTVYLLREHQANPNVHPYTCDTDGCSQKTLFPTESGLRCVCGYHQTWAWKSSIQ
jgi:hypothetical protein